MNNGPGTYTIPRTVTKIYEGALFAFLQEKIDIESGNKNFIIENNMIFTKDKTRLISCSNRNDSSVASYKVPNTVTKMDPGVFAGITTDKEGLNYLSTIPVELPDNLKEIPDFAFLFSLAVPVKIPESIERIGNYGIDAVTQYQQLEIPQNVKEIGIRAFSDLYMLPYLKINENNKWFTIENGVLYNKDKTELLCGAWNAFYYGYQMPDTVRTIKSNALDLNLLITADTDRIDFVIPESVEFIGENAIIFNGDKNDSITVYGKAGSCAEDYIKKYNEQNQDPEKCTIKFLPLEDRFKTDG